ncbi:hypothetical protein RHSIM_Rhsim10G0142200 [Rhododendron simsii]|uniref:WAT1-related protein n=1 Tax=Rhododendron simsii TaxID=118357 RepID=A0A834G9G4_RHOSS|nr:hypothetical protein RHSIM_Rhsim10G0142200 [Rhododendron simsii]
MTMAMGEKKPYLVAILFQFITAGMFILSKAALNEGMNSLVFIFYRQLAGAIVLIVVVIFKSITFGFNVYGVALDYTSPTLAAASSNCLQPMTFFLAILLGMEKVKLRTIGGVAKVIGIMLCMSGVVTLALYKGPYLRPIVHHHLLEGSQQAQNHYSGDQNWIKGCLLMFLATLCWALWYVYQAPVMKDCPSMLIFTTLQSLLSAIQTGAVAIAVERDIFQWKLGWDVRLIAVVYSGIMTSAVGTNLMAWLLEKKGPVFHAMWTPLGLVITTLFSTFLLGEVISLGSVLGGILLVGSLYCVLWGKRKEEELKRLSIQKGALKAEVEQHI